MDTQEIIEAVDEKVKSLEKDVKDLQESLLKTQKNTASFIVVSTFTMLSSRLPKKSQFQLTSLTSAARAKIDKSDVPLAIAAQFYNECFNLLDESGVETLNFG